MNLKNKIIAGVIGVCIAAFGIAGINAQPAQAQTASAGATAGATMTIEQLESIIKNLQQQIALIIELLKQRNLPVCGNGACETAKGETTTSCAADCPTVVGGNCTYKDFAGKCTVTKVTSDKSVSYTFKATEAVSVSETLLTSKSEISPYKGTTSASYLGLACLEGEHEPTADQIKNCKVIVDEVFDCDLSVIKTGSCTPITVKFKDKLISDSGKAKCIATGGTWSFSDCASGCINETRAQRLANQTGCDSACMKANTCNCSSGKYWASREEGCMTKPTTCATEGETINTSGARNCCSGLIAYSPCTSEQDCIADSWTCKKPTTCAKEGETINTSSTKQCCSGLIAYSPCTSEQDCIADSWTCKKPTETCAKEGKIAYASWSGQTPTTCCAGLIGIANCSGSACLNNGSSVCAYCGNGKCGTGENTLNCPKDCKSTCAIESTPYCANGQIVTETSTDGCPHSKCVTSTCAKEGETFSDYKKECCSGLTKSTNPPIPCNTASDTIAVGSGSSLEADVQCSQVATYTCKKTITSACAYSCNAKGYANSRCNAWSTGTLTTDTNAGCKSGEVNLGWTSDCTAAQLAGGGRACCCGLGTPPVVIPEMCGKSLGSSVTNEQQATCAEYGGQILCSNTASQCAISSTGLKTSCGGDTTTCYCNCNQGGGTSTQQDGNTGRTSSLNLSNLSASLANVMAQFQSILGKLNLPK